MRTKFAIVVSKSDPAGMNISDFLIGKHGFKKTAEEFGSNPVYAKAGFQLVFINEAQIFADGVNALDSDFIIFASKHKSESAKPTLTVHPIGNWGKAEMGGCDRTLVTTSSRMLKNYLLALESKKNSLALDYEVSLECTHHGPLLAKPTVFIELGSSENNWRDKKAAEAIADVIVESTSTEGNYKTAVALGGGHYCPEFTKLVLRTDYALSHICPKYALPDLTPALLKEAIEKTHEKVASIIIDEKGLGAHRERVKSMLEQLSLSVLKVRKLL